MALQQVSDEPRGLVGGPFPGKPPRFDEPIRHKTDQVMYRFRKPGSM